MSESKTSPRASQLAEELRDLTPGLDGGSEVWCDYHSEVVCEAAGKLDELVSALNGLSRGWSDGPCFCEMAIDNPMMQRHSASCAAARSALDRTARKA